MQVKSDGQLAMLRQVWEMQDAVTEEVISMWNDVVGNRYQGPPNRVCTRCYARG